MPDWYKWRALASTGCGRMIELGKQDPGYVRRKMMQMYIIKHHGEQNVCLKWSLVKIK